MNAPITAANPQISPTSAAELSGVTFGYRRASAVLEDISVKLQAGRVTALVGPNASGKSTLLRLLLGVIHPWSGQVQVGGLSVGRMHARDRAKWISYVPQRPGASFAFTVRQVLAMGRFGQDRIMADQAIDATLQESGLIELQDRIFAELSGGQQQRVILARATLQAGRGGRVMLLDEPGSHLDLGHAHATMSRLRKLAATGLAVLVVIHDLNLALTYADDAWLLDAGRLVAAGKWDQTLTQDILSPVYGMDMRWMASAQDQRPAIIARPSDTISPLERSMP